MKIEQEVQETKEIISNALSILAKDYQSNEIAIKTLLTNSILCIAKIYSIQNTWSNRLGTSYFERWSVEILTKLYTKNMDRVKIRLEKIEIYKELERLYQKDWSEIVTLEQDNYNVVERAIIFERTSKRQEEIDELNIRLKRQK